MLTTGAAIFIGIAFAVLIVFAIFNGVITKRKKDREEAEKRQIHLADHINTENQLI